MDPCYDKLKRVSLHPPDDEHALRQSCTLARTGARNASLMTRRKKEGANQKSPPSMEKREEEKRQRATTTTMSERAPTMQARSLPPDGCCEEQRVIFTAIPAANTHDR